MADPVVLAAPGLRSSAELTDESAVRHDRACDVINRQKLTVPHITGARRLRWPLELMARIRRDGLRTERLSAGRLSR